MAAVLVTGGTGTLGRRIVASLRGDDRPVRVLSRRPNPGDRSFVLGDLTTGSGIGAALAGVSTIVHCASDPRTKGAEERGTAQLLEAAASMSTPPTLVYISIVGVDRVPLTYYREKLAAEKLIEAGPVPWTILRATQFHDLIAGIARQLSRSPIVPVMARTSFQPIEVDEVAGRLIELAGQPAQGRVDDMGGPEVRTMASLVRTYLRVTGRRRLVVAVPLPGAVARGYRAGGHLAEAHAVGDRTFEEFCSRLLA